ncbi:MAG: GT4 family glycosyltransferase PelF [Microthrixaceae bacterium]
MALITEGNYPLTFGGVSTWCDQLVRHLPEIEFDLVTITGRRGGELLWELPLNVRGVTELAFWEPGAPGEQPRYLRAMGWSRGHSGASRCVHRLLELLLADEPDVDAFDPVLDTLITEAREQRLSSAMRDRWAVDLLIDLWHRRGMTSSMQEVIVALDVLEHLLRTVSFPVPKADVYHAVSNGLAGLVAVGAAGRAGATVVLSEHGVYLRERYLEYMTGDLGQAARDLILRFHRLLSIAVYQRADVILPVSRYNRRWEVQNGVDPDRIRVIHNGVDPSRFPPAAPGGTQRPPTVGFIARIDRIKDPLTLLRAADMIRHDVPGLRVRLWGETAKDQDDYEAECRELVERLGLADVVSFEGRTADPVEAYRSVDVIAMSSISEGLPYGVLEAMMCGTAVVSTDVGGISEALEGVGVLVPPRDPASLAAACSALLLDPVRRADLGRAARRRAVEEFSLERMISSYRAVYDQVGPMIDLGVMAQRRGDDRHVAPTG